METIFLYKRSEQITNNMNNSVKEAITQHSRQIFYISEKRLKMSLLPALKFTSINLMPFKLCVSGHETAKLEVNFHSKFLNFSDFSKMGRIWDFTSSTDHQNGGVFVV